MMRSWSPTVRQHRLLVVTIAGLLGSLLLTTNLWTASDRTYPLAPIIDAMTLSPTVTNLLFALTLITLGATLFVSRYRAFLLSAGLLALGILVLADNTRLQPWIFHHGMILLLFAWTLRRKLAAISLLDAARILVAGIYFWSGVQKMNFAFMSETFPWFTEPLWSPFGDIGLHAALGLGMFVPFIEAAFGLGLLFERTRKVSLYAATAMLVIVLASIGPFGHDWNSAVWPWNLAIYASAIILFARTDFGFDELVRRSRRNVLAWVVLALFWIMPIGSYFELVDDYLSWSLYSGTVPVAELYGEQETLSTLSPFAADGRLSFVEWSSSQVNTAPYPEERVFVSMLARICAAYPEEDFEMVIDEFRKEPKEFDCDSI